MQPLCITALGADLLAAIGPIRPANLSGACRRTTDTAETPGTSPVSAEPPEGASHLQVTASASSEEGSWSQAGTCNLYPVKMYTKVNRPVKEMRYECMKRSLKLSPFWYSPHYRRWACGVASLHRTWEVASGKAVRVAVSSCWQKRVQEEAKLRLRVRVSRLGFCPGRQQSQLHWHAQVYTACMRTTERKRECKRRLESWSIVASGSVD